MKHCKIVISSLICVLASGSYADKINVYLNACVKVPATSIAYTIPVTITNGQCLGGGRDQINIYIPANTTSKDQIICSSGDEHFHIQQIWQGLCIFKNPRAQFNFNPPNDIGNIAFIRTVWHDEWGPGATISREGDNSANIHVCFENQDGSLLNCSSPANLNFDNSDLLALYKDFTS